MSDPFDAYQTWLGIPPEECDGGKPHHYQLLGLRVFEKDLHAIDAAARRTIVTLSAFAAGPHQLLAERLMLEAGAAAACLRDSEQKAQYDRALASGEPLPAVHNQPQPSAAASPAVPLTSGSPSAAAIDYVQRLVQPGIQIADDENGLQPVALHAASPAPELVASTLPLPPTTQRVRRTRLASPTMMALLGGFVGLLGGYFIIYYLLGEDVLRLLPPREALVRLRD